MCCVVCSEVRDVGMDPFAARCLSVCLTAAVAAGYLNAVPAGEKYGTK